MNNWADLERILAEKVNRDRLAHTYRVVETARELAAQVGTPLEQTEVAALMHDYAKSMSGNRLLEEARLRNLILDPAEEIQPQLLHGPVAAALLQEQGVVTDPDVLAAIRWHTTGRASMSVLERVIWLADFIEPGRRFPGIDEVRAIAKHSINRALLKALNMTICFVVERDRPLHLHSAYARNWLLSLVKSSESPGGTSL